MPNPGTITQRIAIEQLSKQIDRPISLEEFVDRVMEVWPSKAKNPEGNIRQGIKDDHLGKNLLFLDENTLLPMRPAMHAVRFRFPLSRQEVEMGWLFVYPSFQYMFKQDLRPENFWFEEINGRSIPVNPVTVKYKEKTLFGVEEFEKLAFDLGWWYEKYKIRRKDSLLVTILDWESARFQLRPEPAREYKKHLAEIKEHNQAFADLVYNELEAARYEDLIGHVAVPTAYLRLKDQFTYPADHWLEIIKDDPRMSWTGYQIRYADWRSPLEDFFADEIQAIQPPKPLSKAQAGQVYQFKAMLWHYRELWRRIEIQGGQTLGDLDRVLKDAFNHEHFDHLSGFWKLVRRGESKRFREVDLGTINPFENRAASELRIADLKMEPGNALKYVYDFGDWIEHRVELEATGDPEPQAKYPRIIAQNKPRYQYCEICKKEGRETIARWICYNCSNQEQRDVLFCDECIESHDEDHYEEEIIY